MSRLSILTKDTLLCYWPKIMLVGIENKLSYSTMNQHLSRVLATFSDYDKSFDLLDVTDDEKCVLILRWNKCPYGTIQQYLGNPSKKWIRQVLLTYAPSLIEEDCNYHKLKKITVKPSLEEIIIRRLIKDTGNYDYGDYIFSIKDGVLYLQTSMGDSPFSDWDSTTRTQIANEICDQ